MAAKQNASTPGELVGGKISAGSLGFDKKVLQKLCLDDTDGEHFIFRVIGMATDTQAYQIKAKPGEDAQEGFGLLGTFEATDRNGVVTNGTTLYLPRVAQNLGVSAVHSGSNIELAMDVYAKYDEDSATSYVFLVRSLIAPDTSAVDNIKKMLGNTPLPQLPSA